MITDFKKYISDDNLVPDSIIDTFYNRIESRLKTGYKKDSKVIQSELNRLTSVNGKMPTKIENLLNDNNF